jgi:hypothetical protein
MRSTLLFLTGLSAGYCWGVLRAARSVVKVRGIALGAIRRDRESRRVLDGEIQRLLKAKS